MAQNLYYKALEERGHNPNLVIITKPARRDSSKKQLLCDNRLSHRMPLRMLVSQKACRTTEIEHNDKKTSRFFSKSVEDILSFSTKPMKNDITLHSKRKKHGVVTPSVRMWLQKPQVTNNSFYKQDNGIKEDKKQYEFFSDISSTETANENLQEHDFLAFATHKRDNHKESECGQHYSSISDSTLKSHNINMLEEKQQMLLERNERETNINDFMNMDEFETEHNINNITTDDMPKDGNSQDPFFIYSSVTLKANTFRSMIDPVPFQAFHKTSFKFIFEENDEIKGKGNISALNSLMQSTFYPDDAPYNLCNSECNINDTN